MCRAQEQEQADGAGRGPDPDQHRTRAHLTRTDSEHLKQGRNLLAAEMALVSGDAVSDSRKLIEATMTAAVAGLLN